MKGSVYPVSPVRRKTAEKETLSPSRTAERLLITEALRDGFGFSRLVSTYERLVYRLAFRFTGNEDDACDVSQEVFLRIHRALPKFRAESSLSTWIYTITANMARNSLRSKKCRERVQVLTFSDEEHDGDSLSIFNRTADPNEKGPARETESRELGWRIRKAMMKLPVEFREAVMLRDMENQTYEDIARLLRIRKGTVKSRIGRGRALLRKMLRGDLSEACPEANPTSLLPDPPASPIQPCQATV